MLTPLPFQAVSATSYDKRLREETVRERLYTGTSTVPTCTWRPLRKRGLGQDLPEAGICPGICANAQQMPGFLKDLLTGIWAFAAFFSKSIINILFSQNGHLYKCPCSKCHWEQRFVGICGHLCCAQWEKRTWTSSKPHSCRFGRML